jgi:glycerate kinase
MYLWFPVHQLVAELDERMHALVWLCACVERRLIGERGCNAVFFEDRQRSFESIASTTVPTCR